MKNLISIICALLLVQWSAAQKMIIHTQTQGQMEIPLAAIDSITFTSETMPGGLMANPGYIVVETGGSMGSTISGGFPPYFISDGPHTDIATAMMNGSMLTVNGVSIGNTSLKVSDNAMPPNMIEIYITVKGGPGGLIADPMYIDLLANQEKTVTIGGGIAPYSIHLMPDPSVATASIQENIVTIKGLANGRTYVVVKDNSEPMKTGTIEIRVRQSFTIAGKMAFASTVKNFSADGVFINTDTLPTNTQGAGGFYFFEADASELLMIGYWKNSDTDWDIAMVSIRDSGEVKTGTYEIEPVGGSWNRGHCRYVVGWNPTEAYEDDPFVNGYSLTSGSVTLSAFNTTSASGTFLGSGVMMKDGIPDLTKPITINNGTFSLPVMGGEPVATSDKAMLNALIRAYRKAQ